MRYKNIKRLRACFQLFLLALLPMPVEAQTIDPSIVDSGTKAELLVDTLQFSEGPVWIPGKGLVFSDIKANTMYLWKDDQGISVFRKPSQYANGNTLDFEGNLITAQHNRLVTRTGPDGKIQTIATSYNERKLNSPNDVVVRSDNSIYFTDPHYGITLKGFGPEQAEEEQPLRGVYRIFPDGRTVLASGDIDTPNGLAFSPDESILYIANMKDGNVYALDVDSAGSLHNSRIFTIILYEEGQRPIADGIKTDQVGNLYVATAAGLLVYGPSGTFLGEIDLEGAVPTNLNWGEDGKMLFITARDKLFKIRTKIGAANPIQDGADVLALIGGKFHNHEYIYSSLLQHYVTDLGLTVEFTIDRRDINSAKLKNYKAVILFVDPVWYPYGYQSDKWNPQYRELPPEITSEPEVDLTKGQRVNWLTRQQGQTLKNFVNNGGGLLLFHQSLIMAKDNSDFAEVAGGVGLSHPPLRPFKVKITSTSHPITMGVSDFIITDEQHFYDFNKDPKHILAESINEEKLTYKKYDNSSPAVWAFEFGKGKVCMLAPGHTYAVMINPEFIRLQKNAITWLLNQ